MDWYSDLTSNVYMLMGCQKVILLIIFAISTLFSTITFQKLCMLLWFLMELLCLYVFLIFSLVLLFANICNFFSAFDSCFWIGYVYHWGCMRSTGRHAIGFLCILIVGVSEGIFGWVLILLIVDLRVVIERKVECVISLIKSDVSCLHRFCIWGIVCCRVLKFFGFVIVVWE